MARVESLHLPVRWIVPVVCVALLAGVGTWALLTRPDRRGTQLVVGERMTATPPLEWAPESRWRTPALLAGAGRVLVQGTDRVTFVTDARTLVTVDAATGQERWSAPYPAGEPRTDLLVTSIDGRERIAAQVGGRLAWWDAESGASGGVDLPDGATVNLRGTAPLVIRHDAKAAGLVRDGRVAMVDLPEGATALAGRSDGIVTAAAATGWWHLRPGQAAGTPSPWEIPGGAKTLVPVSYLSQSIVALLPGPGGAQSPVLVYADRAADVRFTWMDVGVFESQSAAWHPSPSQQWGILGRTLVDLQRGQTTDLGRWTTRIVSADRALGDVAGHTVLAGPTIPLGELQGGEAFPEDLTAVGALVRARVGEAEVVYLLPPRS